MKVIKLEAMLLRWSLTSNGGATLVLQLADADDLEPFKSMTLKKGNVAGQRLACAIVEIGDDEKPVQDEPKVAPSEPVVGTPPEDVSTGLKGGELSQLAGRWCKDPAFQTWLILKFPNEWPLGSSSPFDPAEEAAACVRKICGVTSRAMIDHDPNAGRSFHKLIREPYHDWLQLGGADSR